MAKVTLVMDRKEAEDLVGHIEFRHETHPLAVSIRKQLATDSDQIRVRIYEEDSHVGWLIRDRTINSTVVEQRESKTVSMYRYGFPQTYFYFDVED